ncbi:non-ribosomal peptide synthetase [Puia dinghuensis]|uniref:Carrier domain-containing protein n=1 Tax=Puia dinghuensis TaxID=1792502 RepID=A0A8J2UBF5_9BACT|nr:non-ribosomal peptide synthetase [Puia dinghuensis]GGA93520.1 hypothetical protein GCM10011511_16000 [Puia dinghuensis]
MSQKFDDIYELTPLQQGMLFHTLIDRSTPTYMEQRSFRVSGQIDRKTFDRAFELIFARHDILRTAFIYEKMDKPLQVVLKKRLPEIHYNEFPYIDDPSELSRLRDELKAADRNKTFDLSKDTLMRIRIIQLGAGEYELIWTWHHILFDGWCTKILAMEVLKAYHAFLDNKQPDLVPIVPYKEYIKWLRDRSGEDLKKYWKEYIRGFDMVSCLLNYEGKKRFVTGYHKETVEFDLSPETTARLVEMAKEALVTQNILLKTVWAILLAKYNNTTDVLFGEVVSGRPPEIEGAENIIGLFINTIPIRFNFRREDRFWDLLQAAQKNAIIANDYHHFPLVAIQQLAEIQGQLFNHLFSFQNYPETSVAGENALNKLEISGSGIFDQTSYDFEISIYPGRRLSVQVGFNSLIYSAETVREILQHFTNLVDQVLAHPETKIADLSILSPAGTKEILAMSTGPVSAINADKQVDMLIDEACEKWPDRTAILFREQRVTYKTLYENSNRLANYLHASRIGKENVIGVLMDRTPQFIECIIGIWKANATYMPIDPALPDKRMLQMIEQASAKFLIFTSSYRDLAEKLLWESHSLSGCVCIDANKTGQPPGYGTFQDRKAFWEAVGEDAGDAITAGGWFSSYTGKPLSPEEMDEYAENVVIKLKPYLNSSSRVLEIGCGSGFTMFRLAPFTAEYIGVDQSGVVLSANEKVLTENHIGNIRQRQLAAHQLRQLQEGKFDVIILNSVIQDFESYRYLRQVLDDAISLLKEQGLLFVGDIMDLDRKEQLLCSLETFKQEHAGQGYITKVNWTNELFVSPRFFDDLQAGNPMITTVRHSPKVGTLENELTKYRYDTLISIDRSRTGEKIIRTRNKIMEGVDTLLSYPVSYPPNRKGNATDLAYILFTSGSTGVPKGVMIEHGAMFNHKLAMIDHLGIGFGTVLAQTASQSFDISVWQFITAIMQGGVTAIYPEDSIQDIGDLLLHMEKDKVEILEIVPSYLQAMLQVIEETGFRFSSLRFLLLTGEQTPYPLVERWFSNFPEIKLINAYGPAEAGDDVSLFTMDKPPEGEQVPIGRPLQNMRLYVLDSDGQICPPGIKGELCIAGAGVGRGYINSDANPSFTFDPFIPAERMYKTGDLAKYLSDGNLIFAGRKDSQIKIRGHRIELEEIEACLNTMPAIALSSALTHTTGGSDDLKIYVYTQLRPEEQLTTGDIFEALKKRLPAYMLPASISILEHLPLLPNGKIDKKTLLSRIGLSVEGGEFLPPRTPTEIALASIWQEVLGVEKVGLRDNFFELGGHSLKAIQLSSRVHKFLQVKVNLRDIFFSPLLEDFSRLVEKSIGNLHSAIPTLPQKELYRTSHAQRRLWVLSQFEATSVAYNECEAYEIAGDLDRAILENTIYRLIERHEILRTSFVYKDNELYQKIHDPATLDFKVEYINLESELDPAAEVHKIIDLAVHRKFDLDKAPLLRVLLIRLSDKRHTVLINMHHIINDGWSDSIFINDFLTIYNSLYENTEIRMPPLPIQYKDFSEWQNKELEGEQYNTHKNYWLNQLAGELPVLELPASCDRPDTITYNGKELSFDLSFHLTRHLDEFAKKHEITLFSTLVAILNVLFYKYTGEKDIVIGTYNGSRDHPDLENQIGFYINTLVLRNRVDPDKPFVSFAKAVSATVLGALEHRIYPFDMLIDQLQVKRDLSRAPLFDVLIGLQNFNDTIQRTGPLKLFTNNFRVKDLQVDKQTSIYDLNFMFREQGGSLYLSLRFNTDIYTDQDIHRMVGHFRAIADSLLSKPYAHLSKAEYLSATDLPEWESFQSKKDIHRDRGLWELLKQNSNAFPERIAVAKDDEETDYRNLRINATRIGNFLLDKNAQGKIIAVLADRSALWVESIMGIWAANSIYLPLDPRDPIERLLYFLNDSHPHFLLFEAKYVELANALQWRSHDLYSILCINSPNIYSLGETDRNKIATELWEYVGDKASDDIMGGGWVDSYTGRPFSRLEMDEYAQNAYLKILPYIKPDSTVLEIGCGSGITMFRIAPLVRKYIATDISSVILEKNETEIDKKGIRNIRQYRLAADEIDKLEENNFDIIILNSVAQNFSGYNYFRKVLRSSIDLASEIGIIFLGDLMDEDKRQDLEASFLAFKSSGLDTEHTKTDWTNEFFVNRKFLDNLIYQLPEIAMVRHSAKIGSIKNELTEFRFDSIIGLAKERPKQKPGDSSVFKQFDTSYFGMEEIISPHRFLYRPDEAAYIIYTSGSTGEPKGAIVTHEGLMNHLYSKKDSLDAAPGYTIAQSASQTFDISIWQFSLGLAIGGTTRIFDQKTVLDPGRFLQELQKRKIDILEVVPSYLNALLSFIGTTPGQPVLEHLKTLVTCGEIITPELAARWFTFFPNIPILNAYGPTEAACDITHHKFTVAPKHNRIPVGRPIPNMKVRIVNEDMQICPVNVKGEIVVSGIGVGKGYINREKKEKEVFIEDPFEPSGGRLYRTGDIGRYLANGEIDFFGRKDNQVKIRGVRVELGEVEANIIRYGSVRSCAVLLREQNGEKSLQAFICLRETDLPDIPGLRQRLLKHVPEFLVPDHFTILETLPLLSNGKVDRKTLAARPLTPADLPPDKQRLNPVETALYELWAQVLGHGNFKREDNFFEVGGHSLKAMRLIGLIGEHFNINIPFRELFLNSTVAAMARLIDLSGSDKYTRIEPAGRREYYQLSHSQRRLWILSQFANVSEAYNQSFSFRIKRKLEPALVRQSLISLVARHEILRTVFHTVNEEPMQKIIPPEAFHIDLDFIDGGETMDLEEIVGREERKVFNFETGPLFRVKIIRKANESYFLLSIHHIVTDGWSAMIFMRDLFEFYTSLEKNNIPTLPPLKIQYKDYALWKNGRVKGQSGEEAAEYWKEKLGGYLPRLDLPKIANRSSIQSYKGNSLHFHLTDAVRDALNQLKNRYECSSFIIFNGILDLLFHKLTGQTDIITGTILAGREQPDVHDLIGYFVNTIPIRLTVDTGRTLNEFFKTAKETIVDAFSYGQYPFDKMLDDLKIDRDLSRSPIFDVLIEFHGFDDIFDWQNPNISSHEAIEPVNFSSSSSIFDISFIFSGTRENLELEIEFNTDLYSREQLGFYVDLFSELIIRICNEPNALVSALNMLPPEWEEKMLAMGKGPVVSVTGTTPLRIEENCRKYPQRKAILFKGEETNYQAVYDVSHWLSRHLHCQGIGKEAVVGVLMDRSPEYLISMLGIWNINAAYMPIDPTLPESRIKQMIENSSAKYLINDPAHTQLAEKLVGECQSLSGCLCLDKNATGYMAQGEQPSEQASPEDLAYVLFTSGSTGAPKGVMIEHRNMLNHMEAKIASLEIGPETILAQTASQSFDISIWQFMSALLQGGMTAIYPEELILDVERFLKQIESDKVDILEIVPGYLQAILEVVKETEFRFSSLKYLVVTGETLPFRLVEQWFAFFPEIKIVNAYGPAEAGDDITQFVMHRPPDGQYIPIGRTLQNLRIYVMGQDGHLLPPEVQGEICVSGIGVGRGYINQASNQAFTDDPFVPGERMYKTGDWGKFLPNGNLVFLGRRDSQIKIRGFRIELEEIESCLNKMPAIASSAAVLHRTSENEDPAIIVYVALKPNEDLTHRQIREKLKSSLPAYMLPADIRLLHHLPLLPTGKIDRKSLSSQAGRIVQKQEYVPPQTETELKLTAVWQEVLGVEKIGLVDNFFELGGDSLKLVKIFRKVSKLFPCKLDLTDYFTARTIMDLAEKLMEKGTRAFGTDDEGSLYYLQRTLDTQKTDIFLFPPAGGLGFPYKNLVKQLDQAFNCHLFNYRGIGKNEQPFTDLRDVQHYYGNIVLDKAKADGEIPLIGLSSGGNLIFEIADFLEKKGRKCLLIMLDSEPTIVVEKEEYIRQYVANVAEFTNDTEQGKIFLSRYENALRSYMKIFNSELQDLNKKITSDIVNFICKTSTHEVRLWDDYTAGTVQYVTMQSGWHSNFLDLAENLNLLSDNICRLLLKHPLTYEYQHEKTHWMV